MNMKIGTTLLKISSDIASHVTKTKHVGYYCAKKNPIGDVFQRTQKAVSNIPQQKNKFPLFFREQKHFNFIKNNVAKIPNTRFGGIWCAIPSSCGKQIPWKIHVYSDNEKDWQRMYGAISGYLLENDIAWKTIGNPMAGIESLNDGAQKGKAFTIYPHSNEEFRKVACDLNEIFKKRKLELTGTSIDGDRKLGDSGRLFYRYEYISGKYKDTIIDTSTKTGLNRYNMIYQGNRRADNYLASDMTIADDPWYDFNPNTSPVVIR